MEPDAFDEPAFFAAVTKSGARALLIGRRALVALGIPVLTADYDFWLHADDLEALNASLTPLELFPNHPPEEARRRGRYQAVWRAPQGRRGHPRARATSGEDAT